VCRLYNEQTHEKSGHGVAGIYNATEQNRRCQALLDYIMSEEIVMEAPPKVKARAKDKSAA
jgi:hypothetical protein